jgi:hypothetical protein
LQQLENYLCRSGTSHISSHLEMEAIKKGFVDTRGGKLIEACLAEMIKQHSRNAVHLQVGT